MDFFLIYRDTQIPTILNPLQTLVRSNLPKYEVQKTDIKFYEMQNWGVSILECDPSSLQNSFLYKFLIIPFSVQKCVNVSKLKKKKFPQYPFLVLIYVMSYICVVALRVDFLFFVSKVICFFMMKCALIWLNATYHQ